MQIYTVKDPQFPKFNPPNAKKIVFLVQALQPDALNVNPSFDTHTVQIHVYTYLRNV